MHGKLAKFRFYEELNDFLPPGERRKTLDYEFSGSPSIKDAIEAQGVPHTEVDLILINGKSVGFDCRLHEGDFVSVYPTFESVDVSEVTRLRHRPLRRTRFVLDTHLGKLARLLRMLGFDVLYERTLSDGDIVSASRKQNRIILTRDRGILKVKTVTHGYWLRSTKPVEQVREVLKRFDLHGQIKPFCRCMLCNGAIRAVDAAAVRDRVPERTARYIKEFSQCDACGKLYWKGSHYERMRAFIESLRDE